MNKALEPFCLRCGDVPLRHLQDSVPEMDFFACPSCTRHYARAEGKALTFRWLHPISLALYSVLHSAGPLGGEREVARAMRESRTREEIAAMADEIALELEQPTQQVRDIIGNAAPEEGCRDFLARVVRELREPR